MCTVMVQGTKLVATTIDPNQASIPMKIKFKNERPNSQGER